MDTNERLKRMLGSARDREGEEKPPLQPTSIPGGAKESDQGSYWLRIQDYPLRHLHGRRRLEEVLRIEPTRLAEMTGDPRLGSFAPDKAAFIDTETTSLAGGAGVYVFMAGIGFFHEEHFRVEQYFMRDYDEEPAMLSAFNDRIASTDAMVSFFGKNFDRYRLEDRMNLLGIKSALPVERHLDLYHLGRRLYKGRFTDLRLKTLECAVLAYEREGDIPGAECPEAYFAHLRGEDRGRMAAVFEHNLWDILSLAALAAEVNALGERPEKPEDLYVLGCIFMKEGLIEKALPLLEGACTKLPPGPRALDAHLRMARILKRKGRREDLEEILSRLLELGPEDPVALTELAKHHEHVSRDLSKALDFARRALRGLKRKDDGSAAAARRIAAGENRIHRLQRRSGAL